MCRIRTGCAMMDLGPKLNVKPPGTLDSVLDSGSVSLPWESRWNFPLGVCVFRTTRPDGEPGSHNTGKTDAQCARREEGSIRIVNVTGSRIDDRNGLTPHFGVS